MTGCCILRQGHRLPMYSLRLVQRSLSGDEDEDVNLSASSLGMRERRILFCSSDREGTSFSHQGLL